MIANPVAQSSSLAAPPSAASPSPAAPTAVPVVSSAPVGALRIRTTPDVFISSSIALTPAAIAAVVKATGATSTELLAVGRVTLGAGQTLAIGVDPSSFRPFTPAGTAESTALWQAVANGQMAVAHTVAKALAVPLGTTAALGIPAVVTPVPSPAPTAAANGATKPPPMTVGTLAGSSAAPTASAAAVTQLPPFPAGRSAENFRVGALATTGLPGVGVVVDARYDSSLGLLPKSGLIVTATGRDPVVTAAVATQTLGATSTATALRVPVSGAGQLTWVAPASGPITAGFGYRESPLFPGKREFHGGIDIGAPLGAPIYAASSGSVVYAGPASGFGNEVILQHAGNVETVYGHMERILVTAGSPVAVGQPIALVGSEGESTGPHLHFEVHVNGSLTDPLPWLIAHGVNVQR